MKNGENQQRWDVVVVGAGGSGLAAAVSAAQQGGAVLVLEKRPQPGGTTGIAVGSFTAAQTRLQQAAGVADTIEAHIEDAAKFAEAEIESCNHHRLRAYFLGEAARTLAWLEELGLTFVGPHPEPPNRAPRMHNVTPSARAYIAALQKALLQKGGRILCNAAVTKLLQEEGQVVGVEARVGDEPNTPQVFRARRAVVLAAGDYANNAEMIAYHNDPRFREIEGINPHATGDGHQLVDSVGGKLVNMHVAYGPELRFIPPEKRFFLDWLPLGGRWQRMMGALAQSLPPWLMQKIVKRLVVTWQHPENALFADGAVLINREGKRFVDETCWPEREIGVSRQPGKLAYILFDGRLAKRYSAWPNFISTAPDIAYAYVQDYRRLRRDITYGGGPLEEVVRSAGIQPGAVVETVEAFNRCVREKAADSFGRMPAAHPLSQEPWFLLGPLKAYFTTTEGGAAVNERLQVLDEQGQPIAGLYAVGQNGLGGMVLWGHGLHIAWAMTSGRLMGKEVMRQAPRGETKICD